MSNRVSLKAFAASAAVLLVIGAYIFAKSFSAEQVLFANDGPLGLLAARSSDVSEAWRGVWQDLSWLGIEHPALLPNISAAVWFLLGDNPIAFSKFHVPIALIALGLSLWICLRQFGFRH